MLEVAVEIGTESTFGDVPVVTPVFGGGIPNVFLISGVPNALRTDLEDNVVLVVSRTGGFEGNENEELLVVFAML